MFQTKHDLTGLRELLTGTKRYNELRRAVIGVSPKVLTENLRDMEEDGLLNRRVYPEVPPRVEYTLTTKGEDLRPIIEAMKDYGEKYSNAE
jgi:DNA-binding HxlR family transcriptional regulator